jgi:hypothetical protein
MAPVLTRLALLGVYSGFPARDPVVFSLFKTDTVDLVSVPPLEISLIFMIVASSGGTRFRLPVPCLEFSGVCTATVDDGVPRTVQP